MHLCIKYVYIKYMYVLNMYVMCNKYVYIHIVRHVFGEGNGTPLQYCMAAVHGVSKSRT